MRGKVWSTQLGEFSCLAELTHKSIMYDTYSSAFRHYQNYYCNQILPSFMPKRENDSAGSDLAKAVANFIQLPASRQSVYMMLQTEISGKISLKGCNKGKKTLLQRCSNKPMVPRLSFVWADWSDVSNKAYNHQSTTLYMSLKLLLRGKLQQLGPEIIFYALKELPANF